MIPIRSICAHMYLAQANDQQGPLETASHPLFDEHELAQALMVRAMGTPFTLGDVSSLNLRVSTTFFGAFVLMKSEERLGGTSIFTLQPSRLTGVHRLTVQEAMRLCLVVERQTPGAQIPIPARHQTN